MKVYLFSLNAKASARNQWDFGLLKNTFDNLGFDYSEDYTFFKKGMEGGIVVIPARHHVGLETTVNDHLNRLPWVKLFLIGDEEGQFDISKIDHPHIEITIQNPDPNKHDKYRRMGCGFPIHFEKNIPYHIQNKNWDYFFAGQSTFDGLDLVPPMNVNYRRQKLIEQLDLILDRGKYVQTTGFTKGLSPNDYYLALARAKTAPCPSGPFLPDTFRLFEALELGTVPIADEQVHTKTLKKNFDGYWKWLFKDKPPFPIVKDYSKLNEIIEQTADQYPDLNNKCQAWWYQQKWKLRDDLDPNQKITVVIPVSPIESHPDTAILDETIESVKYHLPKVKIIISFDGVREEQAEMQMAYSEHIRTVLHKHRDIYPVIYGEHRHQSGMMRDILDNHLHTPLLMYVEQDTPLEKDPINFNDIIHFIDSGESNLVRFHHESKIPDEHDLMMLGKDGSYMRTVQWSQRPHIASTAFYRRVMREFSPNANCFLEDHLHGIVWNSYLQDGKRGYNQWRLHIYHPEGNIRRSYHLDGRKGADKYESRQTY